MVTSALWRHDMDDKKLKILKTLQSDQDLFTLEIARIVGMSPATTCKYLEVLKAEGKITSYRRTPFTYWRRTRESRIIRR